MPDTNTQALVDFYSRPEATPLLVDFVADAGGDPDEYGAEDNSVETLLAAGLGPVLKIFTQRAAELGLISDADAVAAAAAEDVDWNAVAEAAERTLAAGMFDV